MARYYFALCVINSWWKQLGVTVGIGRVAAFIGVGVLGALVIARSRGSSAQTLVIALLVVAPAGLLHWLSRGLRTTWRIGCWRGMRSRSRIQARGVNTYLLDADLVICAGGQNVRPWSISLRTLSHRLWRCWCRCGAGDAVNSVASPSRCCLSSHTLTPLIAGGIVIRVRKHAPLQDNSGACLETIRDYPIDA